MVSEFTNGLSAAPSRPFVSIDLDTAFRIAGGDNPTINLAREQINEAVAGRMAARSLMIPNVNLGGNYRLHRGALQDDPGFLRFPNSQALYVGAGAGTIGASSIPVPGLWLSAHLGDAVLAPQLAGQVVAARQSDAAAVDNSVLLGVATTYLELAGAEARLNILRKAESEVSEIVRVTTAFAETGQGSRSDANRATANAELIRRQIREAEGGIVVGSARLVLLLNLDSGAFDIRTPGGPIEQIQLMSEETDLEALLATAVRSRPELSARAAAIQAAQTRVRQERVRPWLPILTVGVSGGWFGGGSNQVASDFGTMTGRTDVTLMAVWNVRNLGVGNSALVRQTNSIVGQATAAQIAAFNQVRREVAEAQAAAKTAARQIRTAKLSLAAAEGGFGFESERIRLGQGRPIEALDSFRQLLDARQEVLRAVVAFDIAQFQLLVALGFNPVENSLPHRDQPVTR